MLQASKTDLETEFVFWETWPMKVEHEVKLDRTEMRMIGWMYAFLLKDKNTEM